MRSRIRVFCLLGLLLGALHCGKDDAATILPENFDLAGEWMVGMGGSASWSCDGNLAGLGPTFCWGFQTTIEQDEGAFEGIEFPGNFFPPCSVHEFRGQVAGTEVTGLLRYDGVSGPSPVAQGTVRMEFRGAVDESGADPRLVFSPERVTIEGHSGECQVTMTFTAVPAGSAGRP